MLINVVFRLNIYFFEYGFLGFFKFGIQIWKFFMEYLNKKKKVKLDIFYVEYDQRLLRLKLLLMMDNQIENEVKVSKLNRLEQIGLEMVKF